MSRGNNCKHANTKKISRGEGGVFAKENVQYCAAGYQADKTSFSRFCHRLRVLFSQKVRKSMSKNIFSDQKNSRFNSGRSYSFSRPLFAGVSRSSVLPPSAALLFANGTYHIHTAEWVSIEFLGGGAGGIKGPMHNNVFPPSLVYFQVLSLFSP